MSLTIHSGTSRSTPLGEVTLLTLAGKLTLGEGCSALRDAIRKTSHHVLVDLSGVGYIDSAGLGELVAGFNQVTADGRALKLLRPGKRVDSMLHITKLYSTFEVFEDEASALASFS